VHQKLSKPVNMRQSYSVQHQCSFYRHSVLHGCIRELKRISNCAVSVDLESLNDLQDRSNCEVFLMRFIDDLCNIRQDAVAELLKSLRTCASDAVSGKLIAKVKRNDKHNTAKK